MGSHAKRISVQLFPQVASRLDAWCIENLRSLSVGINLLVTEALDARDRAAAGSTKPDGPPHAPEE